LFNMSDNDNSKAVKLTRNIPFDTWMIRMKNFLQLKSAQGSDFSTVFNAVDGLSPHSRRKARAYILQSLLDEDAIAVNEVLDVPAMIEYLRKKYVGNVASKQMNLMRDFMRLQLKKDQSISELIEEAQKLARQLATVGQPQPDSAIVIAVLNALPAEYSYTVERLTDIEDDLDLEKVRTSLLRKETQLCNGVPPKMETKALLALEPRVGDKRGSEVAFPTNACFKCGFSGHWARECKSKRVKPGFTPRPAPPIFQPDDSRAGRGGRGGRGPRGRGRGGRTGRRYHQQHPRVHAVSEQEEQRSSVPLDSLNPGPDGRITISLTPEQLSMMTYRGSGASPHVAYTRPRVDSKTGEPTPAELTEMQRCILDSGAGISCTPLRQSLTEFTAFSKNVGCANDTSMPAFGSGTLSATSHTDNKMHIDMSDVWYVPACKHTLISVKALQRQGCWAYISDHWIQYFNSKNEKLFLAVETDLGYEIMWDLHLPVKHIPVSEHEAQGDSSIDGVHVQYINSQTESALLLHARTGHTSFATLAKMKQEGHITGTNVTAKQLTEAAKHTCGICVQAKTARTPFKASQRITTRCLELVHCDLMDFPVTSLGGGKYVLVVTDDYSKWCGVKILKSKAHAKDELQCMLNQWMTITGESVHTLRTDRGGEFVNAEMQQYLADKGIIHQQSIAYAHQQNGKAERANRSLTNTVRALLLQAKFPQYMWAEAMVLACYLRNIEYRHKKDATPHLLFLGTVPDVSTLRVFGCQVYYRVPEELRKKLDSRTRSGFYLGPEPNSKGYRVLTKNATGQLTVKAVRDIVSIEKYMIHGVPSMQCYEHKDWLSLEPAGTEPGASQLTTESAGAEPGACRMTIESSGAEPGASRMTIESSGAEPGASRMTIESSGAEPGASRLAMESATGLGLEPTDNLNHRAEEQQGQREGHSTADKHREAAMLSQLSEEQAGVESTAELPTLEELYDSQNRRSLRERSKPDRYGDWNGSSVNWVKEVMHTLDTRNDCHAVTENVRTQMLQDALHVTDKNAAAQLEACEWATTQGPQVFAVTNDGASFALTDPLNIREALDRPDGERWQAAADSEIESLLKNNTWEMVKREDWMRVLSSKWVMKVKTDSQGLPVRYKARLVVGGHRQVYGVDYEETFASVSKGTTQRALLSMAAWSKWTVRQMDISTAFLHGEIDHEIYMQPCSAGV
jgi:transposase InsO family protein